jgi:hypothetical protein
MDLTITQNGALYALQHRVTKKYRRARQKRVSADLIRLITRGGVAVSNTRWWRSQARGISEVLEPIKPSHNPNCAIAAKENFPL